MIINEGVVAMVAQRFSSTARHFTSKVSFCYNHCMHKKEIVLSGMQPTGELHIGNYLGSLKNFVELQRDYTCYFFIASYHSLSEDYDPKKKRDQIIDLATNYLAAGLDPKRCIIFNQADVPACTELAWIFNTITPVAELERMTQFKDKSVKQAKNINMGLLAYPVLQAADILLYHGTVIPVGQDQLQHVELTRVIARKFNAKFGDYFTEPKPLLTAVPKVMSLIDPEKKMSKSAGTAHYIGIDDSPDTIKKKLAKAVTGTGTETELPAGVYNLLKLFDEFGDQKELAEFKEQIQHKTIKYAHFKERLAYHIANHFTNFRERKRELVAQKRYVEQVLVEGADRARVIAEKTMAEVRKYIGIV